MKVNYSMQKGPNGSAGGSGGETSQLQARPRQQYHYLYGSTDQLNNSTTTTDAASPTATDQDSLVGEALVPTDNEQEEGVTPNASERDLQQLIMTNGNGVHSLSTNGAHRNGHAAAAKVHDWLDRIRCRRFGEAHPVLYCVGVFGALALFFFISAVLLMPRSWIASIASTPKAELSYAMPFPKVDRGRDFNDPVSNFLMKEFIDPNLHATNDGAREFKFPFPTGAFWTNLVLHPTADRGLSYPIAVYPYAYKWSDSLLQVGYPAFHRKEFPKGVHDYFFPDLTLSSDGNPSSRYITAFDPLSVTLRFANDDGGHWETYLVQGSPYVTINYNRVLPVIRAFSIFTRVMCPRDDREFSQLVDGDRRKRRRLSFGVCSSTEDNQKVILSGVQFVIQGQEGMGWIVFSSEPITLIFDTISKTTVMAQHIFNGILRFALIPQLSTFVSSPAAQGNASSAPVKKSTGLQRLIYHAGVYPVAGNVDWSFRPAEAESTLAMAAKSITKPVEIVLKSSPPNNSTTAEQSSDDAPPPRGGRIGTITFRYSTKVFAPSGSATPSRGLLMLALPHHAQSMPLSQLLGHDQFDLTFKCIKGTMTPVVGSTWAYDEPLPSLGLEVLDDSRRGLSDPAVRSLITDSLQQDINLALPTLTENIYGYGKQTARLAQLAHIAHKLMGDKDVSKEDEKDLTDVYEKAVTLLETALEKVLTGGISDDIVYDENLGGLVTSDGLLNTEADFGNGRYNDHLFHYGYLLYSSAVLGKIKPSFVREYGAIVEALYLDVAQDANFVSGPASGAFFPGARHKVWFDGHSYASGLFPFGNGKSQESSSEAVNCYYGAYLWSLVRSGCIDQPNTDTSSQTDFARLLLATEIRGARLYWHMMPPADSNSTQQSVANAPQIYSAQFSKNYMVGNVGMLDAVSSTWFGEESLYVHMINEIPVTAITEKLFSRDYVTEEYAHILEPLKEVEMAWRGYVLCNHAIIDPNSAWQEAQDLFSPELDAGTSKSQILYWIATRKGFNATVAVNSGEAGSTSSDSPQPKSSAPDDSSATSCARNPKCSKAGLTGECCPTPDGIQLGCCESGGGTTSSDTSEQRPSNDGGDRSNKESSCSSHPACATAGLTGDCCPTADGTNLGCCGKDR